MYESTPNKWMGHERSHTNKYGVELAQEKREETTSRNTTNLERSQEQSIELRMPDIVVPNYDESDKEKSRLIRKDCSWVKCIHAREYFGGMVGETFWLSLGYADLVEVEDKTNNGRPWKTGERRTTHLECRFTQLSYSSLMSGIMPEYALIKRAWLKSGGSVFDEVNPFESCCKRAGANGALYVGRKASGGRGCLAPIHGVDYIVLPMSVGNAEKRKTLLTEYIENLRQDNEIKAERTERLRGREDLISGVVARLSSMLAADAMQRAQKAEEEAMARREREQMLKSVSFNHASGLMTAPMGGRVRAMC